MKAGWTEVALGEICEFRYGKALKAGDRSGDRYPVYGSNGVVGRHTTALTAGATIVIGRKGSYGEVHRSEVPCWPIDTTYYVDGSATACDLEWLTYALRGLRLTELNRAAAVPGLNREDAYRRRLPLPPLEEQRRIARVLDACELLRRERQHTIEVCGELVQALFAETSVRHGNSATKPLAELVASDRPITYGILKPGPHVPHGVPYVRVLDIQDGEIRAQATRRTTSEIAAEYRRSVLAPGDLIMSIRGHVGRLAIIPQELAGGNITQDSARLAIRDYDARYVMEAIRSPSTQSWMRKRVKGVAVQGINLADVKMIPIPEAPIDTQREFSARAAEGDRVLARARGQLRHLDALFASLQHRAFTGAL